MRKIAFILASTDHGTLILNRFDHYPTDHDETSFGVSYFLLENSQYIEIAEGTAATQMLNWRREYFGDGVIAVDCGANIGVFTIDWAKTMAGWGVVVGIEAQERIFYALAGNITINNCFNAYAIHAAVGAESGTMQTPSPNYLVPGSFGSLELKKTENTEFIGQEISYTENLTTVQVVTIDSLKLTRLDLLKIDVEGMELEVLEGAKATIQQYLPIIIVEHLKTSSNDLITMLNFHGYEWFPFGMSLLAIHPSDPTIKHLVVPEGQA